MDAPLYVYGVVGAGSLADLGRDGVRGERVALVEQGRLAAAASVLREPELRVRRRDLQAHLDVITAAFGRTTIVPCRFGTVFDSEESLRADLLEARAAQLLELLAQLDGRAQFTLGAAYDEEAVLREIVASEPEIARLRDETRDGDPSTHFARARLGELVAAALEARRERDAAAVLAAVEAHVDAVGADEATRDRVLKVPLLVERGRISAFERAVEELAAAGGGRLRYELVGPLPPTAFVELVDSEAGAWV